MKARLRNGILSFKHEGFTGGRQRVKGDGFVCVEFHFDNDNNDVCITTYDKLNTEDGHYAPLTIEKDQVVLLRDWLNKQLNEWPENG